MSLLNVLSSNLSSVYALIKSYAMNPILAGVPIQTYQYRAHETAEVSKHVLVDLTGGKKFVNDNIAPGPHVWTLEGFIGGLPIELIGRPELMPSLKFFRDMLETAYISRAPVQFVDADLFAWANCAIEELEFENDPTVQNRVFVKVTVRELTILTATVSPTDLAAQGTPDTGREAGGTGSAPSPAAQSVPMGTPFFKSLPSTPSGQFLTTVSAQFY
jgi:hypothetical protein